MALRYDDSTINIVVVIIIIIIIIILCCNAATILGRCLYISCGTTDNNATGEAAVNQQRSRLITA